MNGYLSVLPPSPAPSRGNLRPPWQKGQSGNPSGKSGLYGEVQRLAREASPRAVHRLIELVESDDERVAIVAANSLYEKAWGKPKQLPDDIMVDPADETNRQTIRAALLKQLDELAGASSSLCPPPAHPPE